MGSGDEIGVQAQRSTNHQPLLGERKIKKKKSIKNIYNFREELRPYDKQIYIDTIRKIGAPLLGLAKYII